MLRKLTAKNQITLPRSVLSSCGGAEYFEVSAQRGCIMLKPMRMTPADAARAKLAARGITESDLADAVKWAHSRRASPGAGVPEVRPHGRGEGRTGG